MGMEEGQRELLKMSRCSAFLGNGLDSRAVCRMVAVFFSSCAHHPVLAEDATAGFEPRSLLLFGQVIPPVVVRCGRSVREPWKQRYTHPDCRAQLRGQRGSSEGNFGVQVGKDCPLIRLQEFHRGRVAACRREDLPAGKADGLTSRASGWPKCCC